MSEILISEKQVQSVRETGARRAVLAVLLTVPSSDNEQCMREIEARRSVLAVLWREPGAWQEQPSVTFTPRRCDNGPDWGGVSGCPGTEGPAHCMNHPWLHTCLPILNLPPTHHPRYPIPLGYRGLSAWC